MEFNRKLKDPATDRLFQGILSLETVEECYRFFEDICTVSEIKSLAQRYQVAEMLDAEETYGHIAETTGASTATISRVKRALNYGADGYQLVIQRLKEDND